MLASSHGGINIEEVARDAPESIISEPVDPLQGIREEQAIKVAEFMGFEGDRMKQASHILALHFISFQPYCSNRGNSLM